MKNYRVFTRTWWKVNRTKDAYGRMKWPNGLEPHMGRKTTLGYTETEAAAMAWCQKWNRDNPPGRLSRKAEYERY